MQQSIKTFNCRIVGLDGCGKTTFIKRLSTGEYQRVHVPTMMLTRTSIDFYTTQGIIRFRVFEGTLFSYENRTMDCAILMTDGCGKFVYPSESPSCLVRVLNKSDLYNGKFHSRDHDILKEWENDEIIKVSAKLNYNLQEPFLVLIKQLINSTTVEFLQAPPVDVQDALLLD